MLELKTGAFAVAIALLVACSSGPETRSDPAVSTQTEPSLTMVGHTAFLTLPLDRSADNGELSVSFDAVTEDSRCPSGAQCVWAGNAGIRLTLESADRTQVAILNSTLDPRQVSFAGYAVGYRDLTPYPATAEPHDPDAYVATIAVVDTR
jgi:hypothetical protein